MIHAIDMTAYMTVRECAARAEVSEGTIRRWMDEKRFGWMRKNLRDRLINRREFDAFMNVLRAPVGRAETSRRPGNKANSLSRKRGMGVVDESKTRSGPAPAFAPPKSIAAGGEEYRHLFDAPLDAADQLGAHVSVYYSPRRDKALFRNADDGAAVEPPADRGDELYDQAVRADAANRRGPDRDDRGDRLDFEDREYHFAAESGE